MLNIVQFEENLFFKRLVLVNEKISPGVACLFRNF